MKPCIALLMAMLLVACSSNPPARYAKDGATRDEFDEVVYRCVKKTVKGERGTITDRYGNVTQTTGNVNCDQFNACMASSGFKKSPNGAFQVKDFKDEVSCKQ